MVREQNLFAAMDKLYWLGLFACLGLYFLTLFSPELVVRMGAAVSQHIWVDFAHELIVKNYTKIRQFSSESYARAFSYGYILSIICGVILSAAYTILILVRAKNLARPALKAERAFFILYVLGIIDFAIALYFKDALLSFGTRPSGWLNEPFGALFIYLVNTATFGLFPVFLANIVLILRDLFVND